MKHVDIHVQYTDSSITNGRTGDKAFGGSIPGESQGSATLFATSLDGVSFDKPVLNLVDFNGSKANNILFDGTTAVGIYDDAYNDPNASSRFKCWGNLPAAKSLV